VPQRSWRHSERVAWVDSGDRVTILDLSVSQDEPRILSESASAVWRAVDGLRSDSDIVAEVALGYGVSSEVIEADVRSFLNELAELRVVTREEPGPGPRPNRVHPGVPESR
jgi:hypothetical protein